MGLVVALGFISALALCGRRGLVELADVPGALLPAVRRALDLLVAKLAAAGLRVRVGATYRPQSEQEAVFKEGRSATLASKHTQGLAVDLYPIDPATGKADFDGKNLDLFRRMHAIAAAAGWHGLAFNVDGSKRYITNRFGAKIWDGGHLEWTGPT